MSFQQDRMFGLSIPEHCPEVPTEILHPRSTWGDSTLYDRQAANLIARFEKNFEQYRNVVSQDIVDSGPHQAD